MTGAAFRVVVVGSGIAGLTAALHARQAGCDVTVVTKDVLDHTNTRYAQGGIAGVVFADDSVDDHIHDTLVAGAGLADAEAVEVLVTEGAQRIQDLIDAGVEFDRDADGALVRGLEAAHSFPRILHAGGDATGRAIQRALVERVQSEPIRIREHAFLLDLVVDGGRVRGVEILLTSEATAHGERRRIPADAVVLATGGAGQLFSHTTNPTVATADGLAAAIRAGADVADLEFVQFHPTVMPRVEADSGSSQSAFLISEAVRGEGAVLRDDHGRRFMTRVHPDAELAPRDVVARAIAAQMAEQGGRPVMLDATGLPRGRGERGEQTGAFLARRFPTIDQAVRARGLDWSREPVPVTPAAHYLMGGVTTDLHGRTSLAGLYAVGEVARTGVHGANRLASNSLLEGAVFGARAGDAVARDAASLRAGDGWLGPRVSTRGAQVRSTPESRRGAAPTPFHRTALQELMWTHAGVVRTGEGLRRAAARLSLWASRPNDDIDTIRAAEDANLLLVAGELVRAAIARRRSVGAHYRSDAEATEVAPPGLVTSPHPEKVPA
jgi:L-aspartate oxidase